MINLSGKKIWLPRNVIEAFKPTELIQIDNPRVLCDLTVNLMETCFDKFEMIPRRKLQCSVCGKKSTGWSIDMEELYFCGMNHFLLYKAKFGVPKKFRRGYN